MPQLKTAEERVEIDKNFYRGTAAGSGESLQPGMRLWADAIGLRFDPYRSCSNHCQYCAVAGTSVEVLRPRRPGPGKKWKRIRIENVKVGDQVLGVNGETGRPSVSTVSEIMERPAGELYTIRTRGSRKLVVTGEHPILTKTGWTLASDLRPGDFVVRFRFTGDFQRGLAGQNLATVEESQLEWTEIKSVDRAAVNEAVYNFSCEPHQNYLAGGILVHNCFARILTDAMSQRNKGVPLDPRICRPANMAATQRQFETVFEEGKLKPYDWATWGLSKRFFVETGCLGEPMQAADLKYRVTWNFLSLLQRYNVPLFLNTKANLLIADESYYQHFMKVPLKVVDLTLIGMHDEMLRKVDAKAPLASERLAMMARLRRDGVPVVASLRPLIKGVSDIDWEGFIQRLVDIGVNDIHMRTLIIISKLLKKPKWKRHAEEHMQQFSGEWRYPKEYFVDMFWRAAKVCEGSSTRLVGTRRYWFDLAGYHGKAAFDYMPQEVQDHLFSYTIVPIFRTVKQRQDEPQLMTWTNLGYHNTDVPTLLIGGYQDMLIFNDCKTRQFRKRHLISGDDYLRLGLWEGFVPKEERPVGELSNTDRIYAVVNEDGSTAFDEMGHSLMAYVPPALKGELVREYGRPRRDAVLRSDADGFFAPVRRQLVVPPVDPRYILGDDFEEPAENV